MGGIHLFVRIEWRTRPPGIMICLVWTLVIIIWVVLDVPGRSVIGLPFVLFIPGYLLTLTLFPGRSIEVVERLALSCGLSIVVVPLVGLALNYSPWGIRLSPLLASLCLVVSVFASMAWLRWKRLHPAERFVVLFDLRLSWDENRLDKVLLVALAVSVMVALVSLVYVVVTPQHEEPFTELYLLGLGGMADEYPSDLVVGENASLIVGVSNHEHRQMNYTLETWLVNYSHYLSFDGKNDYVEIPFHSSLNVSEALTMEAWVKPERVYKTEQHLVQRPGVFYFDVSREWTTDSIFYVHVSGSYHPLRGPTLGVGWQHIAATYDSAIGEMKLYWNGDLYSNKTLENLSAYQLSSSLESLYFGTRGGGDFFSGALDDVRLYDRVLDECEIQQQFKGNVSIAGLISWWCFDEGMGTLAEDAVGVNDGIVYGAAWLAANEILDMWYIDGIPIQLNSYAEMDIDGEWLPQWQYTYNFSIGRIGVYRLTFLLFVNETEDVMFGGNYAGGGLRLDEAYRQTYIWVRSYPERMVHITRLFDRFFVMAFAAMSPVS